MQINGIIESDMQIRYNTGRQPRQPKTMRVGSQVGTQAVGRNLCKNFGGFRP